MPEESKLIEEILVPMDFSQCSKTALQYALRFAAISDSRLHLLYVCDEPIVNAHTTDQEYRDNYADKMTMKFVDLLDPEVRDRLRTVITVRFGTAYHEIESYADEQGIDLIIMGNVGRSAIQDVLLGSVTAHVVRHACCPVLTIKHGDTRSERRAD